MNGSAPFASDDVLGRVAHAVDLDRARCRRAGRLPRSSVDALLGQPALLPGVGVVGDHEVAPGERRLDVDLGGRRRLARAACTASPGRSSVFDGMHAQ